MTAQNYTVAQVAAIWNKSQKTVLRRIAEGLLPAWRDKKEWRIKVKDVENYDRKRRTA